GSVRIADSLAPKCRLGRSEPTRRSMRRTRAAAFAWRASGSMIEPRDRAPRGSSRHPLSCARDGDGGEDYRAGPRTRMGCTGPREPLVKVVQPGCFAGYAG